MKHPLDHIYKKYNYCLKVYRLICNQTNLGPPGFDGPPRVDRDQIPISQIRNSQPLSLEDIERQQLRQKVKNILFFSLLNNLLTFSHPETRTSPHTQKPI